MMKKYEAMPALYFLNYKKSMGHDIHHVHTLELMSEHNFDLF